jgi:hypothetical protein
MLFEGGFTFTDFVADAFAVFMFILWFWLLITISGDLFRRHDVSGFGKVLWVILLIVLPYIGIFAYIFTQGRGMAERNEARAKEARDELRRGVRFSAADEIEKLNRLKSTGVNFRAGIRTPESSDSAVAKGKCKAHGVDNIQTGETDVDLHDAIRAKND